MSGLLKWIGVDLVLGVLAGFLWVVLAEPARWQVTAGGTILDEQSSRGRFGVIVTFVLIGLVVSFLWGLLAGIAQRERGWICVPVFAAVALCAALIAWRVGVHFGPPDPLSVKGTPVGGTIEQQLAVDTLSPFLVWPIFALVGLFVAAYSARDRGDEGTGHRDEIVGG